MRVYFGENKPSQESQGILGIYQTFHSCLHLNVFLCWSHIDVNQYNTCIICSIHFMLYILKFNLLYNICKCTRY